MVVCALSGCATPYGPRASQDICSGTGYSEEKTGPDAFLVTYSGTSDGVDRNIKAAAMRRAGELCGGNFEARLAQEFKDADRVLCSNGKIKKGLPVGTPVVHLSVKCGSGK